MGKNTMTQKVINKSAEAISEDVSYEDLKKNIESIFLFIKEYDFLEVYKYVLWNIGNDSKYAWDKDFSSLEYLISIISSIPESEMKMKKPSKKLLKKFLEDFTFLWLKISNFFTKSIEDDLIRKVKSSFLIVKWSDYNEHLYDYNIWLFKDFDTYLSDKLWFTIDSLIDIYEKISKNIINNSSFIINQDNEIEKNILEYFSLELWENKIFNEWKFWWFYWNKSNIYIKPFLKVKNEYYILNPLIFLRNIKNNIENFLKKDQKIWDKYSKKRGEYLEKQSIKYLSIIFPWSKSYNWLKYEFENEIYETDWILIYDNNLFILEAKAWVLREKSKNWAPEWLNEDIDKLVSHAYYQAVRAREYIEWNSKAVFKNKLWKKIIFNWNNFNKIFLLNITWDYLWEITLYTNDLRERWNIDYKYDFLPIYINSLRVYSELIEFPSQFTLFLERRLNIIRRNNIRFSDEMDMLIYFNKQWLIFPDWFPPNHEWQKSLYIHIDPSLSHEIDNYYYWKDKIKPKMNIDTEFKYFINLVELINKYWFSELSNIFLWVGWGYIKKVLSKLRKNVLEDNYIHTWTCYFNDFWILFILHHEDVDISNYFEFSKSRLGKNNITKMYNVFIKFNKKSSLEFYKKVIYSPVDFDIIRN